jgi:hypothetical protein
MANEMNTFKQLAGEYRDGGQKLTLRADGKFAWVVFHVPKGTDAGMAVTVSGKARIGANSTSLGALGATGSSLAK